MTTSRDFSKVALEKMDQYWNLCEEAAMRMEGGCRQTVLCFGARGAMWRQTVVGMSEWMREEEGKEKWGKDVNRLCRRISAYLVNSVVEALGLRRAALGPV